MALVEERVDRLEDVLKDFVTTVGIEFSKLYNSQMRTEAELRTFKDEMKDFNLPMSHSPEVSQSTVQPRVVTLSS